MAPISKETQEFLGAQALLWNHTFSFIRSMSLKCAIELGIPDIIQNHGSPISLSDLVAATGIHPTKKGYIGRIMRLLVHSGFFTSSNNGGLDEEEYELTPSSKLIFKDTTKAVLPLVQMTLDPVLIAPWHTFSLWLKAGSKDGGGPSTPFENEHRTSFWHYAVKHPEYNHIFNEVMAIDTRLVMSMIVKECGAVFEGLKSLVDVGGGTGMAARVIAEAFPELKCTVFDQPHVVNTADKRAGMVYVGGSAFDFVPSADAVFLKWIIHSFTDEECVKILRNCKEAIPPKEEGGKVIIFDMVLDPENGEHATVETQLFYDMLMMSYSGGKERSEVEWQRIFKEAGFTSGYKITHVLGVRSMMEVYP